MENMQFYRTGESLARLRSDLGATQTEVAKKASVDQSRLSRIEKSEIVPRGEIERVLGALLELGSTDAEDFMRFMGQEWHFVEPPSYWNPERGSLANAEKTLAKIDDFLADEEQPWPLRRQIDRRRSDLERATSFLTRLRHNVAFIGDMGVGKSTAISFLFDLLVPAKSGERSINRPVLETGAGGTTICEVHIGSGPEFGITVIPMESAELTGLVSDFCAVKWVTVRKEQSESSETPRVGREVERAIRNMSGFVRRRVTSDGKTSYQDPILNLVGDCEGEDDLRARILEKMDLRRRTNTEVWYSSGMGKHPLEWLRETYRAINNGRMRDVPLPKSIRLSVPHFGRTFGEFEITVIDTKGVDDVAVREDIDLRLSDPRTSVVFCCRFNDAPGTGSKALLEHMKQTSSERFDTGKVSILALPRSGEALEMKDDMGEPAFSNDEGYEFKRMQVEGELHAEDMPGIPLLFLNVEVDDAAQLREELFGQLSRTRETISERLSDLCAAATEIIENREKHAVTVAIEEVARRLNTFLLGNRNLGARERHAYKEAVNTVGSVRYASTLWASTRRNGEYSGLNIVHQVGIGTAKDALLRSRDWFTKVDGLVKALLADEGLKPAKHSIEQIWAVARASREGFLAAAQRCGMETYREPLTKATVWSQCVSEWGRGPGFKNRIVRHLLKWFEEQHPELKERLENRLIALWERSVIEPLMELAEEQNPLATGCDAESGNVEEASSAVYV